MFTVCPGCQRQFRIYAEQIAAASGEVRCGFCHTQFNTLERLHDQPLTPEQLPEAIVETAPPRVDDEPQFEIPEAEAVTVEDIAVDTIISKDNTEAEQDLQRSIAEIDVPETPAQETAQPEPQAAVINLRQKKPATAEPDHSEHADEETPAEQPAPQSPRYTFTDDEPDLEEASDTASPSMRGFWSIAALLAVLVIAGQLVWFNRDRVLLEYPQLRPYVSRLCATIDCAVIRGRDTRAITLVNRDVRLHPSYQDTLLVNATMQNELSIRQPYPRVQLTLFDTAGALIGYREFLPGDYLDSSIEIDQGMPVAAPVHFVLEVAGSSEQAVSFEFRFL